MTRRGVFLWGIFLSPKPSAMPTTTSNQLASSTQATTTHSSSTSITGLPQASGRPGRCGGGTGWRVRPAGVALRCLPDPSQSPPEHFERNNCDSVAAVWVCRNVSIYCVILRRSWLFYRAMTQVTPSGAGAKPTISSVLPAIDNLKI